MAPTTMTTTNTQKARISPPASKLMGTEHRSTKLELKSKSEPKSNPPTQAEKEEEKGKERVQASTSPKKSQSESQPQYLGTRSENAAAERRAKE